VEAKLVLDLARRHAAAGGAVLFIGHRLDEVREVSDRIIVLRNGRLVADFTREEVTEPRLINAMVGIEVIAAEPAPHRNDTEVLTVRNLTAAGVGPLDLRARKGEIVGIAGLMGSGRSRLIHTIAGAQPLTGGEMTLNGAPYRPQNPSNATKHGVTLIPEDRKLQALIMFRPISENVTMGLLRQLSRSGVIGPRNIKAAAQRITGPVRVRMRSVAQPIGALSGGNQQRAIFGRAFAATPKLLLLDEPTRGVDVGAKAEIYELIEHAAASGMAVLCVSSELEELLRLCHRVVVLRHGVISAEFDRAAATKEKIMTAAASGVTGQARPASDTSPHNGGNR
jgi:ABC-type sugar transport system ATPase subunit